jgi:hexokinase
MRQLLAALFEAPNADDVRQQLLGVTTLAEARAMSDTAVFAAVMRVMGERDAGLAAVLRSAQVEILGRVDEGRDTTHVVYRMAMTVEGTPITRMDVMTLARSPNGWRGLLKGDLSALGAAVRAAVQRR